MEAERKFEAVRGAYQFIGYFYTAQGQKLVTCYITSNTFYGVETWTLRTVDQKYFERFEM
jgi:hypothetical protein